MRVHHQIRAYIKCRTFFFPVTKSVFPQACWNMEMSALNPRPVPVCGKERSIILVTESPPPAISGAFVQLRLTTYFTHSYSLCAPSILCTTYICSTGPLSKTSFTMEMCLIFQSSILLESNEPWDCFSGKSSHLIAIILYYHGAATWVFHSLGRSPLMNGNILPVISFFHPSISSSSREEEVDDSLIVRTEWWFTQFTGHFPTFSNCRLRLKRPLDGKQHLH